LIQNTVPDCVDDDFHRALLCGVQREASLRNGAKARDCRGGPTDAVNGWKVFKVPDRGRRKRAPDAAIACDSASVGSICLAGMSNEPNGPMLTTAASPSAGMPPASPLDDGVAFKIESSNGAKSLSKN
jgi:hypothetical protein